MCIKKITESINKIKNNITNTLKHLWLIGSLFQAGRKTCLGALYEFTYLFLWSILPFALGALTLYVISDAENKSLLEFGKSTFRNGELLVFTISMLAPILYLTLYDPDKAGPFPHKLPISTAVALIVVTCAALFALLKAHAVKDTEFVFKLSIFLTLLALGFRYLALIYHRLRMPDLNEIGLRSAQNAFVADFDRHHPASESQSTNDFMTKFKDHLGDSK